MASHNGPESRSSTDVRTRNRIVCVDTTQLDAEFAGRAFDHDLLAALPGTVDPCGERGEFHTFVTAGPMSISSVFELT